MYLFYVDDSGNTGTTLDVEQPIHWLVGVGFTPTAIANIERELLALALQHFPIRARHPSFEFHGMSFSVGAASAKG